MWYIISNRYINLLIEKFLSYEKTYIVVNDSFRRLISCR